MNLVRAKLDKCKDDTDEHQQSTIILMRLQVIDMAMKNIVFAIQQRVRHGQAIDLKYLLRIGAAGP